MRTLAILGLVVAGCSSPPPSTGGDTGPVTRPVAGGADTFGGAPGADTGGDNGGGGNGGAGGGAILPPLMSGNYSAVSSGLTENTCQTTPLGADLGTWAVKVVTP